MRVTPDSAILIRALVSPRGPAMRLFAEVQPPKHRLVLSRFILDEVERVLSYPRMAGRKRSGPELTEQIDAVCGLAEFIEPAVGPTIIVTDPNDDPVLYTAVAARADVLCTRDRHFYDPGVLAFCGRRGIRVMDDLALLNELLLDSPGPRA